MQKKICSLFLVPCISALFFIISCGDDGDDPQPPVVVPSSSSFSLPPGGDDNRITLESLDTTFDSWKLKVRGIVNFSGSEQITKIEIKLHKIDDITLTPILLSSPSFWDGYNLEEGQGDGYNFSPCDINKNKYQIYVFVYLNNEPSYSKADSVFPKVPGADPWFQRKHPDCIDYNLTIDIVPPNGGNVERSKQAPYSRGDVVSLEAKPATNYAFFNWTDGSQGVAGINYGVTISGEKVLTANFVESYTLVQDAAASKKYESGPATYISLGGDNAILFNGGQFLAQGNAKIKNQFKSRSMLYNSPSNKIGLALGDGCLVMTDDDYECMLTLGTLKKDLFVTADNGEETLDLDNEKYFVVTTSLTQNKNSWFLLLPKSPSPPCASGITCTDLTVWKVQ